jgi:hypothetical protein
MHTALRLSLFSAILGVAVVGWAAVPMLVAYQSQEKVQDPVLGTWILNVAKSKYSPGPAPKSQRRIYEAHPQGVKATIETVYSDGHSATIQYIANYDGVEYPVTGAPDSDAIALKRVDSRRAESTLMHAGQTMATARRVISEDGKTMTITYEGMWDGKPSKNVAVYEKEGP